MKDDFGQDRFRLDFGVFSVIALIASILVGVYVAFPYLSGSMIFGVSVIAAMSAAYVAYLSIVAQQTKINRDKMRVSMELYCFINNTENFKARDLVYNFIVDNKHLSETEFVNSITKDKNLERAALTILNNFEFMASNIINNNADEGMLYRDFVNGLEFYATHLLPLINHERRLSELVHGKEFYRGLISLNNCWKIKKSFRNSKFENITT